MLSASNDGCVCLWNCAEVETSMRVPRQLTTSNHTSGIFSLHELENEIVIGSKDWSITLSTVTCDRITTVKTTNTVHDGVVKCVRWQRKSIFASASNDGTVGIVDTRVDPWTVAKIESAHDGVVNVVEWHPQSEHILASTGFDSKMCIWDIRKPTEPVHALTGHTTTVSSLESVGR